MRRFLRVWVAKAFVSLADRLLKSERASEAEEPEEDDDEGMPMGTPVVLPSQRAEEMVMAGARFIRHRPKEEPAKPLSGSIADRIARGEL